MTIKNLQNIPAQILAETFNLAFSDYLTPISLDQDALLAKMASENTDLSCSAGAYSDGKLVGFILIGIDFINNQFVAYNGGTGVIPDFRGQKLTARMYDFLLPLLAEKGITSHRLEVITENQKAIPVYEKIGFERQRIVTCFRGMIRETEHALAEIKPVDFRVNELQTFWDFAPTYQNSVGAIVRTRQLHQSLGAFADGKLAGYIVFSKANARIKQFAVAPDFRRKGIGHQLFDAVQQAVSGKIITLINVDHSDEGTIVFLKKIGLETTVQQYEMTYRFEG